MTTTDSVGIQRLPDDLAERFVRDGYVVVDNLISAPERRRIVADAVGFIDGTYPVSNPPEDDEILAVHFPHRVSPVAHDAVVHPGIAEVVGTIAGAHLPGWDGRTKCMQSMLFFKPPGLQGQAWHQDERFIPTRDRSLVGAWIALDDATIENGCLWVLPGSHRMGMIHPTRAHEQPDEFDRSDEAYGFDDSEAVPVEVSAGAVVFFNGYLLHRSFRNRSTGTRMALVNHYMNAWSLLPWQVGHGIDVGTADTRAIVPVTGDDPYQHKGIVDTPGVTFVRPRVATPANGSDNIGVPQLRAIAATVMVMRLLVRKISRETKEQDLRDLFEAFGSVQSCVIVMDEKTGRSKGFGFVEMPKTGDAKAAIYQLNGHMLDGEAIRVKKST